MVALRLTMAQLQLFENAHSWSYMRSESILLLRMINLGFVVCHMIASGINNANPQRRDLFSEPCRGRVRHARVILGQMNIMLLKNVFKIGVVNLGKSEFSFYSPYESIIYLVKCIIVYLTLKVLESSQNLNVNECQCNTFYSIRTKQRFSAAFIPQLPFCNIPK